MKCPGQDTKYWTSEAIFEQKCPKCQTSVEFFKDDTARKCPKCGHKFVNPKMDFGCAAYCQFAEQCIGTLPDEVIQQRGDLLKDMIAIEMKKYFKSDFKRIGHASRVARYAEQIGKKEGDGNLLVILAAAYLHDIGIHEAEKKYSSTAPKYQEQEGPPIAKKIMEKLKVSDKMISEVCDIIGHHHHPKEDETVNFKVLYDADLIANIEDNHSESPITKEKLQKIINKSFLTKSGVDIAEKILFPIICHGE